MSEQQQIQPKRTEEAVRQPAEISHQVAINQIPEEIFDADIDIDISDLVQESMDIAKVYKQKGGQ